MGEASFFCGLLLLCVHQRRRRRGDSMGDAADTITAAMGDAAEVIGDAADAMSDVMSEAGGLVAGVLAGGGAKLPSPSSPAASKEIAVKMMQDHHELQTKKLCICL